MQRGATISEMITDPHTAKRVSELMYKFLLDVDETVQEVRKTSSNVEYVTYAKAAAKVFEPIMYQVLDPIYVLHPELKPPKWDKECGPGVGGER
jgi:hypothetical protein